MTDDPQTPGWYDHPGFSAGPRWWDGARWHDHRPSVQQPPLPSGTSTNTWPIWALVVLPIAGLATTVLIDPVGLMRDSLQRSLRQIQNPTLIPDPTETFAQTFTPGVLGAYALSFVLIAVNVLLAVQDERILRARGVVQPMPWGWAFLQPVYVIGRSVVVRRRVRGSLSPLLLWIAITVIGTAISLTLIGIGVVSVISSLN